MGRTQDDGKDKEEEGRNNMQKEKEKMGMEKKNTEQRKCMVRKWEEHEVL